MEDIYAGLDNKAQARKLRKEGLSYSQIGDKLGVGKSYIIKILKGFSVSGGVTSGGHQKPQNVPNPNKEKVDKYPVGEDPKDKLANIDTLGELKSWIKEYSITYIEIEHLKETIQNMLSTRLASVIKQIKQEDFERFAQPK